MCHPEETFWINWVFQSKFMLDFIGKIGFQIHLRKILSEPWVISFEQLHLVAEPQDINEVNFCCN